MLGALAVLTAGAAHAELLEYPFGSFGQSLDPAVPSKPQLGSALRHQWVNGRLRAVRQHHCFGVLQLATRIANHGVVRRQSPRSTCSYSWCSLVPPIPGNSRRRGSIARRCRASRICWRMPAFLTIMQAEITSTRMLVFECRQACGFCPLSILAGTTQIPPSAAAGWPWSAHRLLAGSSALARHNRALVLSKMPILNDRASH